ncbi:dicarboxylate carrier 1 isoform X6 [Lasioglossum baleicum]|uniref:dicarboxylate carrier 1 isoform X6 n=1 Tax=Lasioglossum baleicum TaxID=434251 RepID=UPI003FCD63E3
MADKTKKLSRWYFGGLSSAGAACVTHPLDLLKVHLQTQQEGKVSVIRLTTSIIQKQGVLALYNGLSASLLRQLTYSTMRFGAYEVFLVHRETWLIYKHALDGVVCIIRQEGVPKLFSGCSTATLRAALMTIGQLSFYDQIKIMMLQSGYFVDNPLTHVLSSVFAGAIATTLTQPLDVLKTRAMNAKPGEFKNLADLFFYTAKHGPLAFFKGYVPAFIRLAPQTILTFVFLEQLRSNFGFYPTKNSTA